MHKHKPGIFHLDLKPENILVTRLLELKICDFGLSKTSNLPHEYYSENDGPPHGTLFFMAPELLINKKTAKNLAALDV